MRELRLKLKRKVSSRNDVVGLLRSPGDAALIERGRPRVLVIKCPSGCGEEVAINLDRQAGKAWRFYQRRGAITLFPSVWRDTGCECHFIVARNKIYVFEFEQDNDQEQIEEPLLEIGTVDEN